MRATPDQGVSANVQLPPAMTMRSINLEMIGPDLNFETARRRAAALASEENPETMLISWSDGVRGVHSPQCLKCEIHGRPGWDVYGENHGGRLRIRVNSDRFVFIFS
jgi:hypothetical protein